jgi:hypothetical protein
VRLKQRVESSSTILEGCFRLAVVHHQVGNEPVPVVEPDELPVRIPPQNDLIAPAVVRQGTLYGILNTARGC